MQREVKLQVVIANLGMHVCWGTEECIGCFKNDKEALTPVTQHDLLCFYSYRAIIHYDGFIAFQYMHI